MERRRAGLLVVIWLVLFLVMFAWYVPIAAGDRFVLPVIVPLLAYAAAGGARLVSCAVGDRRFSVAVIGGAVLWCLVWSVASWPWLEPPG